MMKNRGISVENLGPIVLFKVDTCYSAENWGSTMSFDDVGTLIDALLNPVKYRTPILHKNSLGVFEICFV